MSRKLSKGESKDIKDSVKALVGFMTKKEKGELARWLDSMEGK